MINKCASHLTHIHQKTYPSHLWGFNKFYNEETLSVRTPFDILEHLLYVDDASS